MSTSGIDASELTAFYDSVFVQNCCGYASLMFLVYEYVITFGREVDYFWRRKPSGASVLFFVNRYLPIISNVVSWVGLAPLSDQLRCSTIVHVAPMLEVFQYVPWAVFAALRVFALSGRHWPFAVLVFLLAIVPFAINLYLYTLLQSVNEPIFGCEATRELSPMLADRCASFTIASRTCLMAADVLVIATTWIVTYGTVKLHRAEHLVGSSFAGILLRDGTLYFVVLLVVNALHLAFTLSPIVHDSLAPLSYVTLFTEPITAVLISRFMLNLQGVNRRAAHADSAATATAQLASINFDRVLGSLGSDVVATPSIQDSLSLSYAVDSTWEVQKQEEEESGCSLPTSSGSESVVDSETNATSA